MSLQILSMSTQTDWNIWFASFWCVCRKQRQDRKTCFV